MIEQNALLSIDSVLDLGLHSIPDFAEGGLGADHLVSVVLRVVLYPKLIVRDAVAEMQPCRDRKVSFQRDGELCQEAFSAGRSVCDEHSSFGGVERLSRQKGRVRALE